VKNRFSGEPTPSGYRDINLDFLYHRLVVEVQIHLRAVLTIADKQHVAYEYAREMDLMGVLEKSEAEDFPAKRGSAPPRSHWGYFVARMVPAIISVVIDWLYIDAFTLKGFDVVVKRAGLLPTKGFSPPYVTLRFYGLILAVPYFTNAFLLLRAAGCFGEAARNQRKEKTRIALLYTSATLGTRARTLCGRYFWRKRSKWRFRPTARYLFSSYLRRRSNACAPSAPRVLDRLLKKVLALRSCMRS